MWLTVFFWPEIVKLWLLKLHCAYPNAHWKIHFHVCIDRKLYSNTTSIQAHKLQNLVIWEIGIDNCLKVCTSPAYNPLLNLLSLSLIAFDHWFNRWCILQNNFSSFFLPLSLRNTFQIKLRSYIKSKFLLDINRISSFSSIRYHSISATRHLKCCHKMSHCTCRSWIFLICGKSLLLRLQSIAFTQSKRSIALYPSLTFFIMWQPVSAR